MVYFKIINNYNKSGIKNKWERVQVIEDNDQKAITQGRWFKIKPT